MEASPVKKLLAAGFLAGLLGFGGMHVASAQTDGSTTTTVQPSDSSSDSSTATDPGSTSSDSTTPPADDPNCPNMGTGTGGHARPGAPPSSSSSSSTATSDTTT